MEIIIKCIVTGVMLIVIYLGCVFTIQVWRSHIDVNATISGWFSKLSPETSSIVVRSPNKIYQDGKEVGDIMENVDIRGNDLVFEELINTASLNREMPIEYGRRKLRIVSIGSIVGSASVVTDKGSVVKHNILRNVVCKIYE